MPRRGEREVPPASTPSDPDLLDRLDAIDQKLAALTRAVSGGRAGPSSTAVHEWLVAAAADPHAYDVPDAARMSVKVRVLPALYARLEQTRARFGLQTLTGTWECLLRLGLAAAERLPAG